MQVTREAFQAAIEDGIAWAVWLDPKWHEPLREVGRHATEASVGHFENCPATQAGISTTDYVPGRLFFANKFDRHFPNTWRVTVID